MPPFESPGAFDRVDSDSAELYSGTPRALGVQGQRTLCNTAARFFNTEADLLGTKAMWIGVAIKISRDGQVQIYTHPDTPAVLL